jgi:hypothetical protein
LIVRRERSKVFGRSRGLLTDRSNETASDEGRYSNSCRRGRREYRRIDRMRFRWTVVLVRIEISETRWWKGDTLSVEIVACRMHRRGFDNRRGEGGVTEPGLEVRAVRLGRAKVFAEMRVFDRL